MPSRRQIREATIQFLYCFDLEGEANAEPLRETFWQFLTETDRRNLTVATFRTVQHLAHGRETRLSEFVERSQNAIKLLSPVPETDSLTDGLNRLLALESSWSLAFSKLTRIPKDGEDDAVANEFEDATATLFKIDHDLEFHRKQVLRLFEDHPHLKARTEAVAASIRRLQRISDRLRMVEAPENFPDQADLAKIRHSKAEITALKAQTDQMVTSVLSAKDEIDTKLSTILENYSPERIDPVDRAILRLGAYELLKTDTPSKVIINEAIEIAKRFGTTDSQRFVNGLLDSIAKIRD
ncbi:MAG: transcription antitermination factor NusB [Akkermansiaceae bacterium]